ncbi:hypothetical protein D9C73_025312 [Collichthys lucidus]|uniref:Uncharacterized protein n=1 Tax=Collichthys lucidus TaxID=240159 RepID=A0A4U5VUR3_COLLU|nr:hypothetical protein D9C73_025312 [Collichthys lucidus]
MWLDCQNIWPEYSSRFKSALSTFNTLRSLLVHPKDRTLLRGTETGRAFFTRRRLEKGEDGKEKTCVGCVDYGLKKTPEQDIILEIQIDPGPSPTTQDGISEEDHSTSLTDTNTSLSSSDNDHSSRIEHGTPIGRRTSSQVIPRPTREVSESEAAKENENACDLVLRPQDLRHFHPDDFEAFDPCTKGRFLITRRSDNRSADDAELSFYSGGEAADRSSSDCSINRNISVLHALDRLCKTSLSHLKNLFLRCTSAAPCEAVKRHAREAKSWEIEKHITFRRHNERLFYNK